MNSAEVSSADVNSADELAAPLVAALLSRGWSVAAAESLTGGAVAAALASVPGVSASLQGGVVAYQNRVKHQLLGVDSGLLERAGSVDGEVAGQMADGAARELGADVGIATTGAAGPDAHDGKPVGTVFVAVSIRGESVVEEHHFTGGRNAIRAQAAAAVLVLARRAVER